LFLRVWSLGEAQLRQFTVIEMVAVCCIEPDVAVTVAVEVAALRVEVKLAPPQPFIMHSPTPLTASSTIINRRCRFLNPKQKSATASTDPGNRGPDAGRIAAAVLEAFNVRLDEAGVPDGVTVGGEKLHEVPDGSPEQVNETAELNPLTGVIETMLVLLCPAITVNVVGEAATEKSGVGRLMVNGALAAGLLV
jgi:hypothetical protein